jgi:hypothetical protein
MRGVGGAAEGLGHGALSEEGDFFAVGMELLHDVVCELVIGNGKERNLTAARDDGRKEELDLGSEQNKVGVRRWLFKGFEERVAAGREHLFSIVDNEDFDGSFEGRKACFLDELAHIGNRMLIAFGIGKDEMDVGMLLFSSAHERFCNLIGKVAFSDAVWSIEEEDVRKGLLSEKPA